jgi:hypothetical protein
MKKIFLYTTSLLNVTQTFKRPLSILLSTLMLLSVVVNVQAQCPSPTATTAAITTDNTTVGTTSITSGVVRYVTGNITYGTSANAQSVDVQSGGTLVISAGSHFTCTNLSVSAGATLIIQAGASISVVGITSTNGNLNVNGGGVVKMCENAGIEGCGTTAFTSATSGTYAVAYVGATGGKAVLKTTQKLSLVGSGLVSSASGPFTTSPNITVAMSPLNSTFSMIAGSNLGAAYPCTIGSNCTALPFTVSAAGCGEFAGQTALTCPTAGSTAPTLTATTKTNVCPATTVDLTTITATNLPSNTTLTWHTGTPATSTNKVTGTSVATGVTYYAAFYDAAADCYSGVSGAATTAVTTTATVCTVTPIAVSNTCPATTVNLSTHETTTAPSGSVFNWYTSSTPTVGTKVADKTQVGAGTYYGAYFDATNNCYSPVSTPITVTINTCAVAAVGAIDCNKTQLATAPVFGTASQLDLIVTVNVTTVGTFSPLSISGSGMTIANGITSVTTTKTGIQQFHIPVNYDGTALGTMNYTIGQAGTCAANLTNTPKSVITSIWTLDNCTPKQVSPKLK